MMISGIAVTVFCVNQLLGYARILIWAMICLKVELAARLIAAESQLAECKRRIIQKQVPKPRFTNSFRLLWVVLSKVWAPWKKAVHLMQPATVVKWHRSAFRMYWRWKSSHRPGRPPISEEMRALIRRLSTENPLWGAGRIRDTLILLVSCQVTNVGIYGHGVRAFLGSCGREEVRTAYRSPWQNPYVERFIGTLRRELLNHVIVLGENHLKRLLKEYIQEYYHLARPHQGLEGDTPLPGNRPMRDDHPTKLVSIPICGGLHHRYERIAA